jgi:hypothetical protein
VPAAPSCSPIRYRAVSTWTTRYFISTLSRYRGSASSFKNIDLYQKQLHATAHVYQNYQSMGRNVEIIGPRSTRTFYGRGKKKNGQMVPVRKRRVGPNQAQAARRRRVRMLCRFFDESACDR